ncbi:restriction endonuclease subunit M [Cohnella panacarvi]|uniref:restriction endonuclease subunit M n=1 Tax=Cohnella panacarvi TaxID=400776 RepID=UPI00047D3625|nr:restriction endonuclease subunit M [Cohnella panacarvi]
MKSVISYPCRGKWGRADYRGNCSGHVIKDLLELYRPRTFLEIFAGGGTGFEVARELGYIDSAHLDLNPKWGGWNALKDEVPVSAEFIFCHPPYYDIVVYSGEVWGHAHEDDLSRARDYEDYIRKLNIVHRKLFDSLPIGGRLATLLGDCRKKGIYYSIIKDMEFIGSLESHIIKVQHNLTSSARKYRGFFIPIIHEHLLIFRK